MSNADDMLVRVTPEEMRILVDNRRTKAARENNERIVAEVLNTAAMYKQWLFLHNCEDTYSAFCDEFGYKVDNSHNLPRAHFYALVIRVMDCAFEFVMEGV